MSHCAGVRRFWKLSGGKTATFEISISNPGVQFCGINSDSVLIDLTNCSAEQLGAPNLSFRFGDVFQLERANADEVILLKTFSWMPSYEEAMREIASKVAPQWIG